MKTKLISVMALLLLSSAAMATALAKKPRVISSVEGIHSIVEVVGGEAVVGDFLAKGSQDVHFIQAKPSYMVKVNRADILFSIGLELEVGWLPLIVRGARNPSLQHIEVWDGIQILGIPKGPVSRADGDVHSLGNPHYMLDPRNGLSIGETIQNGLSAQSPGNKVLYESNYLAWSERLRSKIKEWEKQLQPLKGIDVIDYHSTFDYLYDWLDLNIANYVEPKPGVPPTSKHLRGLVEQIGAENIPLLLCSRKNHNRQVRFLAKKTDIRVAVLPVDVGDGEGTGDYIQLFDTIAETLLSAFSERKNNPKP